jgi:Outer membrane protein beta-barrel domain
MNWTRRHSLPLALATLLCSIGSAAHAQSDDPDLRPATPSLGIGAGVTVPSTPLGINTASLRIRVNEAVAIEPALGWTRVTVEEKQDSGGTSSNSTSESTSLDFELNGRFAVATRGAVDLEVLGGLAFGTSDSEVDPEGPSNTQTSSGSSVGLQVGVGLEAFRGEHWSCSLDGLARLASVTKSQTENEGSDSSTDSKTTAISLPLDPTVRAMVHLYF